MIFKDFNRYHQINHSGMRPFINFTYKGSDPSENYKIIICWYNDVNMVEYTRESQSDKNLNRTKIGYFSKKYCNN